MTGDDLIVAAPWLAFAAGLAVIGWRLAVGRGRRRGPPGAPPRAPGADGGARRRRQDRAGARTGRDEADDRPA